MFLPKSFFQVTVACQRFVVCLCAGLVFSVCLPTNIVLAQTNTANSAEEGTDSDEAAKIKALLESVDASLKAYNEKTKPVQDKMNKVAQDHSRGISDESSFIQQLKTPVDNQLEKVRDEHARLTNRLRMLERLEDALTAMEPDAKEKAIEKAEDQIKKFEEKRNVEMRPVIDEMSAVHRSFMPENGKFAEHFKLFYREKGAADFDGFRRSSINANFSSSQVSGRFESDDQKVTVSVIMNNPRWASRPDRPKVADKYEILHQSSTNMNVKVGNLYVSMHVQGEKMDHEMMRKFLPNVLDLAKLEKVLGDLNNGAKK